MNLYNTNMLGNFFTENATADKLLSNRKYINSAIRNLKFTTTDEIDKFVNIIESASSEELSKYLEAFDNGLNCKSSKDVFFASQMLHCIITKADLTDDQKIITSRIMNKLNDYHKKFAKDTTEYSSATNDILRKLGHKIDIIKEEAICGIRFNDDDVYFRTAYDVDKYKSLFESIVFDNVQTDVTGLARKKDTVDVSDLMDYLRDFSYNNMEFDKVPNNEFLIARIDKYPRYVHEIVSGKNVTDDAIDGIFWLITQTLSAVRRNDDGLERLYTALDEIEDDMETISVNNFTSFDAVQNIKTFITHTKASIQTDRENIQSHKVERDVSPLTEMGFGYFFEIMPLNENFTEEMFEELNRAATEVNALGLLQESINILNEADTENKNGIISHKVQSMIDEHNNKTDIRREGREERARLKQESREERAKLRQDSKNERLKKKIEYKRQLIEDKQKQHDDKLDTKRQAKQDRADRKNQDKLDRVDERFTHKKERREQRYENRREINAKAKQNFRNSVNATAASAAESIRSIGATEGGQKIKNTLHTAVSAALVGGAASMVGISPVIGASLFAMKKRAGQFRNDQTSKSYTRGAMVSDIEKEIARIDGKIEEFRNQGNDKGVTKMETLKKQLENARESIYNNAAYQGGVAGK